MQNSNFNPGPDNVALGCFATHDEDTGQMVVFELIVPVAAKVPAPCQPLAVAELLVGEASITSTVRGESLALLRANNTVLGAAWCITATLAAPESGRSSARC